MRLMRPTFDLYLNECRNGRYRLHSGLLIVPPAVVPLYSPYHAFVNERKGDNSLVRPKLVEKVENPQIFNLTKKESRKRAGKMMDAIFANRARKPIVCTNVFGILADDSVMPGDSVCPLYYLIRA